MMRVWSLLLATALLAQGCANYQLGTGTGLTFATLYVAPAKNKTSLAQSQALVSTLVREAFIKDARVSLVDSAADADATLELTLVGYHRQNAGNREDDNGLARRFALKLSASCTLRDNRTGKLLFEDRVISVRRNAFTDNGIPLNTQANGQFLGGLVTGNQLQSEYNTFPLLAKAMADKVAHAVLDVW